VALWFLDRHLRRNKPEWLGAYHRCLMLLPLLLGVMLVQLARTPSLADDNGLFWRITQHAGAELLPNVSSHMLVSTHVFLELLHYGVWIFALPLIGASGSDLESKLDSAGAPDAWISKIDRGLSDPGVAGRGCSVDGLFDELRRDARHLFCGRDRARAGRSSISLTHDLILEQSNPQITQIHSLTHCKLDVHFT
jgi:hypothetical protein